MLIAIGKKLLENHNNIAFGLAIRRPLSQLLSVPGITVIAGIPAATCVSNVADVQTVAGVPLVASAPAVGCVLSFADFPVFQRTLLLQTSLLVLSFLMLLLLFLTSQLLLGSFLLPAFFAVAEFPAVADTVAGELTYCDLPALVGTLPPAVFWHLFWSHGLTSPLSLASFCCWRPSYFPHPCC
jgi:hypothetical protein